MFTNQQEFQDVIQLALTDVPVGTLPDDWNGDVVALGEDFLGDILQCMIQHVMENDKNLSDYDMEGIEEE